MNRCPARAVSLPHLGGIQLVCFADHQLPLNLQGLHWLLERHGLLSACQTDTIRLADCTLIHCRLAPEAFEAWVPAHDTLNLHQHLPACSDDPLEQETLLALLASPLGHGFPGMGALHSHLRTRCHIAQAAHRTALAFRTEAAERPEGYWRYDEENGFVLQPGADLIEALVAATQPERTGQLYDFSCYRATEYVILLGIARELQAHNPEVYQQLQQLCGHYAIRSRQFHDVFVVEYGSMESPLPARYYVPGDRLWFRNPDERSSDVTGYEGSWVIYMGNGRFSNFWRRDKPYTLEDKCLEIYHWRDGAVSGMGGILEMDESVVENHVADTRADPDKTRDALQRMMRWRDPKGVYAHGGCLDTTREFPRGLWPVTCELTLPLFSKTHNTWLPTMSSGAQPISP